MGKSKNDPPTHEEIWDDSALVRSWDEAVEEYQLYHSIHAKGENVEDVLKEAEDAGITQGDDMDEDVVLEESTVEVTEQPMPKVETQAEPDYEPQDTPMNQENSARQSFPAAGPKAAPPTGTMPMPEAVMANVQDENLKRLMMSWYFAGYYTGLYEGQQQAQGKS
ncbi:uncharacterized protein N7469_006062 [Penicillium citrinum]|uniref:Survival Motor Neuron Gemin2-binding domain-containing protein n=1 Tax=Penicillium citrinum TaxID=5077 RepID=A0A9W9TNQ6_PENCI|nr:uncharacterized protein N7469_006062 [Penicillium citrinum]KAJ5231474.1 hypothetical protein N7469_006062 [Penicillium citrinum]